MRISALAVGNAGRSKRDDVARAALELFVAHGFHGLSMATIAERARVGVGTVYRYFRSKDSLIEELFREVKGRLEAALSGVGRGDRTPRERFVGAGTELLRHFIASPLDFLYLEQFHTSPYCVLLHPEGICPAPLRELFEMGVAGRHVRDLPSAVLYSLAFGPLMLMAKDHILKLVILDEALVAQAVQGSWDGISA